MPKKSLEKDEVKVPDDVTQDKMQEKMVLYQIIHQRLEELKQHITLIQQKMVELETIKQALEDMKGVPDGKDILLPVGSGFFAPAKSVKTGKILVEIGAGVMVKKTVDEAKAFVERKKKEVEDASQHIQMEFSQLAEKANEIAAEVQATTGHAE